MKYIDLEEFKKATKEEKANYCKRIAAGEIRINKEGELMSKINVIETRVKELLEQIPETRENDHALYRTYIKTYHFVDFNEETFVNYTNYGLPSFKSIERARRKIQNEYGLYRASDEVVRKREEAEKQYRDYATENID